MVPVGIPVGNDDVLRGYSYLWESPVNIDDTFLCTYLGEWVGLITKYLDIPKEGEDESCED